MLKELRKVLNIDNKELDAFLNNKSPSTKYYLEKSFFQNKLFKYFLFLRMNNADMNQFFDKIINNKKNEKKH